MGCFSWKDCVNNERVICGRCRSVYVLVPKEFGGEHITETCYDGYGHFGGHDIYDLAADWNREFLSGHPEFTVNGLGGGQMKDFAWYQFYADTRMTREDVENKIKTEIPYMFFEWREIGITIACLEKDNKRLPFPIKITYDENAVYEDCKYSKVDPGQGCF